MVLFVSTAGNIMNKKKQRRLGSMTNSYCLIAFNTVVKKICEGCESGIKLTLYIGTLVNVRSILDGKMAAIKVIDDENRYSVSDEDLWKCSRESLVHVDSAIWPYLRSVTSPVERVSLLKHPYRCDKLTKVEVGDLINVQNGNDLTPAVVKYKGIIAKKGPGIYFGVELLEGEGDCDGNCGAKYFDCPPGMGLFVSLERITVPIPNTLSYRKESTDMLPSGKISSMHIPQQPIQHNGDGNYCDSNDMGLFDAGDQVVWVTDDGPKVGVIQWISDKADSRVCVEFNEPVPNFSNGPEMNRTVVLPSFKLIKASDFFCPDDTNVEKDVIERLSAAASRKSSVDHSSKQKFNDVSSYAARQPSHMIKNDLVSPTKDVCGTGDGDVYLGFRGLCIGSLVETDIRGHVYYGVVRWIGLVDKHYLAGIEMEEDVVDGTDGTRHGKTYFYCPNGRGLFLRVSDLRPDSRFNEVRDPFVPEYSSSMLAASPVSPIAPKLPPSYSQSASASCIPGLDGRGGRSVISGLVPPISREDNITELCGKYRGIQGHHNSCYLDATLFSMFTFTSVLDSLLLRPAGPGDMLEYSEVQRVLREEIVNPLRADLFVSSDRVMKLRHLMDRLSNVSGLTTEEKDPEEFLMSLFAQILRAEPFLKLSSGQEAYLYQLFLEKDESITFPTVQQLFDQSFLASDIKLTEVPSCLIIQMPRFGKSYKMYSRILPSQVLDITDVIHDSPRQCTVCGKLALFECKECFNQCDAGLQSISFCQLCLEVAHTHEKRRAHVYRRLELSSDLLEMAPHMSVPRVYMSLSAVVCIETSHYVSFVKCGTGSDAPWCFFDSMADRKGERDGFNIPEVVACPDLAYWLSDIGSTALHKIPDERQLPEHAKRLLCDAYMCIYQSNQIMMYR